MEFRDGDTLTGYYGNTWTREDGKWWLPSRGQPISDESVEWLMGLNMAAAAKPSKQNKISKTSIDPAPPMIYRFTMSRSE